MRRIRGEPRIGSIFSAPDKAGKPAKMAQTNQVYLPHGCRETSAADAPGGRQ